MPFNSFNFGLFFRLSSEDVGFLQRLWQYGLFHSEWLWTHVVFAYAVLVFCSDLVVVANKDERTIPCVDFVGLVFLFFLTFAVSYE